MDPIIAIAIFVSSSVLFLSLFLGVLMVTPCWDEIAVQYCGSLCERFQRLGMGGNRLRIILRLWGMAIGVALAAGYFLQAIPLGLFAAAMIVATPTQVLQYLIRQHEGTLRSQMVQASAALANSMRAGMSLKQAIEAVAVDTAQPLKQHLQRIAFETDHGRPLAESLDEVRQRLDIESFSLFAAAISVNLERGGPINESLARISRSLQENERLYRKLDADTAAGRQMLVILAAFPVVFLVLFGWLEPHGVSLMFQTLTGQLILMSVGIVVCVGVQWGRRIMTIDL